MRSADEIYYDWMDKLAGLLDFRVGVNGYEWLCGDPDTGDRLAYAKQAATAVGIPFDFALELARRRARSICCDCEIVFNADDRPEPEEEDWP